MSVTRFALLTALLAVGCRAPYACSEGDSDGLPTGLVSTSSAIDDSFRAAAVGDAETWRFRATLRDLPELWPPSGAVLSSALEVRVSLAYETPPLGGDGRTQMPRIQVTFPNPLRVGTGFAGTTAPLHGPLPETFRAVPLEICSGQEQAQCCPYGSRECAVDLELKLERVDGTPFPPVAVHFSAQASAETSPCPLEREEPSLALVQVDP